jgi:diguanylate cyclase (GGDEF)-like protein
MSGGEIPEAEIPDDEIGMIARARHIRLHELAASQADLRQRLKEVSYLKATAALLSHSLDMDEVLGRMLAKVVEIFAVDAAEICVLPPSAPAVRAQRGLAADWLAEETASTVDAFHGDADEIHHPTVGAPACCNQRAGFLDVWCVPLRAQGGVTGRLSLHSRTLRRATPRERELLLAIGSQIATALSNILLHREVQRLSTTDTLTRLHNRRGFEARLADEMKKVRRYKSPLAAVMIDIDHFKQYNDTYGHPAGDAILQQVAAVIRSQVRETDFVARYGGEEFVLLLPETGKSNAMKAADKIRMAVEASQGPGQALTISLGVAASPEDTTNAQALIELADQALYRAKEGGRNRVDSA